MSDAMIEFSCVYCGQPVRVGEELARRQIECPACGHTIRVCPNRRGEALRFSSTRTGDDLRRAAEHWSRMSDEEIREAALVPALPPGERQRLAYKRALAPWLPHYDDLTLFTFALALAALIAMDSDLRRSLMRMAADREFGFMTAWLAIIAIGAFFSLINVFFRRDRTEFENTMMLFFAIMVTIGTGLFAGESIQRGGFGLLALFPLWNFANGVLLLALGAFGILDEDCLGGERPGCGRILLATVAVVLLVTACHYLFRLDSPTTFSIAVAYTMSLHHAARRLFGAFCVARG